MCLECAQAGRFGGTKKKSKFLSISSYLRIRKFEVKSSEINWNFYLFLSFLISELTNPKIWLDCVLKIFIKLEAKVILKLLDPRTLIF